MLNEYDIVANGIRSLKNQLNGRDGDLFSTISGQLEKIESAYRIDRDRLWLIEVGDETLYVPRDELQRRARGGDPLAELSVEVEKLKSALAPLALTLETITRRKTELDDEIQEADHSAEKAENLDRLAYELAFGRSLLSSAPYATSAISHRAAKSAA